MRVETHQRRVRAAVARLNAALTAAEADDLYVTFTAQSSENNDQEFRELSIRSWEIEESGEKRE